MIEIRQTEIYSRWFKSLRDRGVKFNDRNPHGIALIRAKQIIMTFRIRARLDCPRGKHFI